MSFTLTCILLQHSSIAEVFPVSRGTSLWPWLHSFKICLFSVCPIYFLFIVTSQSVEVDLSVELSCDTLCHHRFPTKLYGRLYFLICPVTGTCSRLVVPLKDGSSLRLVQTSMCVYEKQKEILFPFCIWRIKLKWQDLSWTFKNTSNY